MFRTRLGTQSLQSLEWLHEKYAKFHKFFILSEYFDDKNKFEFLTFDLERQSIFYSLLCYSCKFTDFFFQIWIIILTFCNYHSREIIQQKKSKMRFNWLFIISFQSRIKSSKLRILRSRDIREGPHFQSNSLWLRTLASDHVTWTRVHNYNQTRPKARMLAIMYSQLSSK